MFAGFYKCSEIAWFLNPDSIVPDPLIPQSPDMNSYVRTNQINFSDPSGHSVYEVGQYHFVGGIECFAPTFLGKIGRLHLLSMASFYPKLVFIVKK